MNPLHTPRWDDSTLSFVRRVFAWARAGDADSLAPVLAAGLPPSLRNEQGDSLLTLAAYHGHAAVVQQLLQAGADPDALNDRGQTALAAASFRGHVDVVRQLLQGGADVDRPPGGRTPFMLAAMFNRVDVMQVLKEGGCNPWVRDEEGLDALQMARRMGAEEAQTLLCDWLQRRPH